MFATPETDPTAAVRAAERTHDLILEIVAEVVGPRPAPQYGGLVLTSAHVGRWTGVAEPGGSRW